MRAIEQRARVAVTVFKLHGSILMVVGRKMEMGVKNASNGLNNKGIVEGQTGENCLLRCAPTTDNEPSETESG